ncbi:MAG: nucleotide exchange factor GrpE [Bacteroides sp.]|nr:nucleotide exchange factor GrpE [Bacillota bacterium]MCM1394491.1 nucleotide exchange factor GrpE [[Eubacterium] siraeum]MCM1455717.1 nucleotide exchange factor GrpE [Bacteroides sp.]
MANRKDSDIENQKQVVDAVYDLGIDRDKMSDQQYISALEYKLATAMAEVRSYATVMQRLQADFDNYRRRNSTLSEDMKQLGQTSVIEKFLTVLDNCDLARKYIHDEAALTGFNMMEDQILDILESFGLAMVDTDDADFDVRMMSAVDRVKCASRQGKVVEVLAKGYTLNGKLLRPASVKVGY